jgi:hypothetical protein
MMVIDARAYNDPILLSSKPYAKQPCIRYHISIVFFYYKAQSSTITMHGVLI